jgi:hypothetical protein
VQTCANGQWDAGGTLTGTFSLLPAVNYASIGTPGDGNGPTYLVLGDLNGDCKPDLAVTNRYTNSVGSVGVFLNNGDGTFGSQVNYPAEDNPSQMALGDLNGDGKADLATANSNGPNNVSLFLNHGDGTFAAPVNYAAGGNNFMGWIELGDLNGDCKLDVVAADSSNDNNVSILLNKGDGTFATVVKYPTGGTYPMGIALGDLNGDGTADIVVANQSTLNPPGGNVGVLLNQGNGTFATAVIYATGGSHPQAVAIGDLNGDGKPDLAVTNVDANNVGVLLNQGDGTFAAVVPYTTGGLYAASVALGDLNGDCKPDLAVVNEHSNNVGVLLNQGDGTFAAAVNYTVGPGPNTVVLGDLNGDGKLDVAVSNYSSNNVSVLINNTH